MRRDLYGVTLKVSPMSREIRGWRAPRPRRNSDREKREGHVAHSFEPSTTGAKTKRYNSLTADSAAVNVGSITVTFGIDRNQVICLLANCRVAVMPS